MEFDAYQEKAKETIQKTNSEDKLSEIVPYLGIIGEIGSVVTQLKIKFRDGDAYVAFKEKLSEELGDVLWYINYLAVKLDIPLKDVAMANIEKLQSRKERSTLKGQGDDR